MSWWSRVTLQLYRENYKIIICQNAIYRSLPVKKGMLDACVAELVRAVDWQLKYIASNLGSVESISLSTERVLNSWKNIHWAQYWERKRILPTRWSSPPGTHDRGCKPRCDLYWPSSLFCSLRPKRSLIFITSLTNDSIRSDWSIRETIVSEVNSAPTAWQIISFVNPCAGHPSRTPLGLVLRFLPQEI